MDIRGAAGTRALVLGGGGVTGIAWLAGLLDGLADGGVDVDAADRIVGTSAGAIVGAFLALGHSPRELATSWLQEIRTIGRLDLRGLSALLGSQLPADRERAVRRLAGRARAASGLSHDDFVERISGHLVGQPWPDRLTVVTVDALTGRPRILDAGSGVRLTTAVAASCAVPGVFPPVRIDGVPHLDGGLRTPANIDLAAGADRVIALTPLYRARHPRRRPLNELRGLPEGTRWLHVRPDSTTARAIGLDLLNAERREHARDAGRRQARAALPAALRVWRD